MRGEYHYPEEECFLREDIDEVKEDETSNGQDDIGNQLFDESSNDLNETGNEPDENRNESDENSQIQNKQALTSKEAKKQDFKQNAVGPSSMAHIHQTEEPTWIVISFKKEIVLDVPDKSERKVMKKEEKKKGTGTNNLFKDARKRSQTEDNQAKKKQTTDGLHMAKKPTFRDFIGSLFSCFRKPKKVEAL
ncbi:uncharacterized protein LOC127728147 [Mytilus californianus]|uniref:uncharacterized protein LOC127728147 n=1 Tax=Mytilus californianus TaxID=6549 RepID=UPI002245AA5F|nr:uncharacterized protein LOC127728147 [Mytilus californianus]